MVWRWLKGAAPGASGGSAAEPRLSRRQLVKGLGTLGAVAVAAPALLAPSEAAAEAAEIVEAQYGGPGYHRGRGRGRGHARGRRHPHRRRLSAREVRRRCRRDRRFRRRNPGLCHRVLGWRPPRRGACIQIGPLVICDG